MLEFPKERDGSSVPIMNVRVLSMIGAALLSGCINHSQMHAAAHNGDVRALQAMIDSGVDVDTRSSNGQTPLMSAASGGELEAVMLLLNRGADPNAKSKAGSTPLSLAAFYHRLEIVKALLHAGANVNETDNAGATALMAAAAVGDSDIVQVLLQAKADPERRVRASVPGLQPGDTALSIAQRKGHMSVVTVLQQAGVTQ